MNVNYVHDIENLDIKKLKKCQDSLKHQINLANTVDTNKIKICAGVDAAYWEKDNVSYGACSIVLIDFKTKKVLKKIHHYDIVNPNYISNYLSLRELPLIIKTISKIPPSLEPDLFILDGNGILHPKSMGIATHISFFINKPTIGVAKSYSKIHNIEYIEPKNKEFAYTNITIKGKTKGVAFKSHKNTNPIFISPGNFIDLETSIECVKQLIDKDSKLPIPTRYANIETHKLRNMYNKQT